MSKKEKESGGANHLVRSVAVSVGAVALVVALGFVPVPGLHFEEGMIFEGVSVPVSVGALGIVPFALGFVLVEWIGSLWPGSPGGRVFGHDRPSSMGTVAVGVGLALATLHAGIIVWYWFVKIPSVVPGALPGGPETGIGPMIAVGSSLVAGAALHALAAHWIGEYGFGDGFAVVIGVGLIWNAVPAAEKFGDWLSGMNLHNLDVFGVLWNVLAVSVVILGTLWVVRQLEDWVVDAERGSENRPPDRAATTPFHTPLAGVVPFAVGSVALWAFWTGRTLSSGLMVDWFGQGFEMMSYGGNFTYFLQELGVVAGLGIVAGWIAARFDSNFADDSNEDARTRRRAQFASLGFLVALVVADVYGGPLLRAFGVVNLVLVTAIAADLAREWSFRRAFPGARRVATLHRTGAVGPVLDRLGEADVPALARSRCFRGMLRSFGAFSAVEIYVPESCRSTAEETVDELRAEL